MQYLPEGYSLPKFTAYQAVANQLGYQADPEAEDYVAPYSRNPVAVQRTTPVKRKRPSTSPSNNKENENNKRKSPKGGKGKSPPRKKQKTVSKVDNKYSRIFTNRFFICEKCDYQFQSIGKEAANKESFSL